MMIDFKKYENESTLIWLVNNVKLPKKLPWAFEDRPWQIEIIEDKSKYITCRKPTQIGMSTVFLGKMLHFADTHTCRAMLTLPRQDDVYDMVNSRLSEIIRESPYIRSKIGQINNVRMKEFGDSWLHFAEMSVEPRMMDVDWMVNDEVDLSNPLYLEQVNSRMDASKYGYHHKIGTPTIDGYGVDSLFELSDKKHWVVKCRYCLHEQHLTWDENIAFSDKDGAFYKCARCSQKITSEDIRNGQWIQFGSPKAFYSGYQINHLMVPMINPNKLWAESKTMSPKSFYNLRLGMPYTPTSGSITSEFVRENCFNSYHSWEVAAGKDKKYILGADQGNEIHVVVGHVDHNERISIVFATKLSFEEGFAELEKIVRRYNISMAVLDALPNHHSARQLADRLGTRMKVAYFTKMDAKYKTLDGQRLHINKTDAYDYLVELISSGKIQFPEPSPRSNLLVNEIVSHMSNMRRDIIESKTRTGAELTTHLWKSVGKDHFADAMVYAIIAADILVGSKTDLKIIDISKINDYLNAMGMDTGIKEDDKEVAMEPNLQPANPYLLKKGINKV